MYESYEVIKPIRAMGWFIMGTLYGLKDRRADLRRSMTRSMDRVAELTEADPVGQPRSEDEPARPT